MSIGSTRADTLAYMEGQAATGDTAAILYLSEAWLADETPVADTAVAFSRLRQAARSGCLRASLVLGDIYLGEANWGIPKIDHKSVFDWYRMGADHGYAYSIGRLGRRFLDQDDPSADLDSAVVYLVDAAKRGHAASWYWLSRLYTPGTSSYRAGWTYPAIEELVGDVRRPEHETRRLLLEEGARRGCADSQFGLGYAYKYGSNGFARDYALAKQYYEQAAAQGIALAYNNLGVMHEYGQGVPVNKALAFQFYKKSAMRGDAMAQRNLGLCLAVGRGTNPDPILA
ncbi:MAG: tetratricopeptide repeat protein, partial [bacterium]